VKKYLSLAAVAGILALLLFAYCSGKSAGSVKADDKELQHRVERAEKAAKIAIQSANAERANRQATEKKLAIADSLVKKTRISFNNARASYNELRREMEADTISDPLADQLGEAADAALQLAEETIHGHELKDVVQDSVIASVKRENVFLRQAIVWKEDETRALNQRLNLTKKRVRNAHKNGALIGAGAAVFAVLAVKASR
jgi:hypothetical protein